MKPHELLGTAAIPGGGELKLYRHDGAFTFRVNGTELMTSRVFESEQALAELALRRVKTQRPKVLVGGLGMGFTLARGLELASDSARFTVVELIPEVIEWNRDVLGHVAEHPLNDPRVTVKTEDVVRTIRRAEADYDIILLDVDNGPEGLTRSENDRLYSHRGLEAAHKALRPDGILAIWSSTHETRFTERFTRTGFDVEEKRVRARGTKGPRRTIWLGQRANRKSARIEAEAEERRAAQERERSSRGRPTKDRTPGSPPKDGGKRPPRRRS